MHIPDYLINRSIPEELIPLRFSWKIMLFRFLIIIGVAGYILYKIGSFFFKIGAASQQMRQRDSGTKTKDPKPGKIKGGDYVDYEEVK